MTRAEWRCRLGLVGSSLGAFGTGFGVGVGIHEKLGSLATAHPIATGIILGSFGAVVAGMTALAQFCLTDSAEEQ